MNQTIPAHTGNNIEHCVYIAILGTVFAVLVVVFAFFPRSRYSQLEKRDLANFPGWELLGENPQEFTAAVSRWFSDSEPYRDRFMTMSMALRDGMRVSIGAPEEAVSFKPTLASAPAVEAPEKTEAEEVLEENAKVASSGIVIVGSGKDVRALMAFGGSEKSGSSFVELVNEYAEHFPGVSVYALVAPLATEFYIPKKAASMSNPQKPLIDYVRNNLSQKAKFVDAYSSLASHTSDNIYLRTDHHWAPLGAFYAAKTFAETAQVPFRQLDSYDRHVVRNFVGSMYGYSKDISVKNAPEDFVYYTPKGLDYNTTYVTYNVNKDYQVTSQSKPWKGKFFHQFKDGSGGAYSTFMGGDQYLVKVQTGAPVNRRLLIIKDSYGNALPGYLFYSFNEVHVVDFRYFKENMRSYVAKNQISDILFAFNVFNVCSSNVSKRVRKFIDQTPGDFASLPKILPATDTQTALTPADSVRVPDVPDPEAPPGALSNDPEIL